jgi:hypothetical protein
MVSFLQTLEKVDKSKKTNWLSDHPAPPDRIARIQKEAQLLRVSPTPTTNVADLRNVQGRLQGFGPARTSQQIAQGTAAGTSTGRTRSTRGTNGNASSAISIEPPSSSLRSYTSRSGVYRISYPSNWQVYEQGNTGVTIAPPGAVMQSDIVAGAIISHYDPFHGRGLVESNTSLDDATNDLLATLRQSSPYLRVASGSGQRFRMAGGTALAATLRGTDPNTGVDERVTVVTRQLSDDHLIYMLFIAPERDASRNDARPH